MVATMAHTLLDQSQFMLFASQAQAVKSLKSIEFATERFLLTADYVDCLRANILKIATD